MTKATDEVEPRRSALTKDELESQVGEPVEQDAPGRAGLVASEPRADAKVRAGCERQMAALARPTPKQRR